MSAPRLSVVVPYYRNPMMLDRQLSVWAYEWPDSLKELVEVVLVDDASPESAWAVIQSRNIHDMPALQLLRVKVDTPWHQHAARNLGAHVARGATLLMTDCDHVVPADLAAVLCKDAPDDDVVAFFDRVDAPSPTAWHSAQWHHMRPSLNDRGAPKPHVNSFALTRDLYWRVGGYDESYCGVYGTDALFRRRLFSHARRVDLPLPLIRVDRGVIPDASTVGLERKSDAQRAARAAITEAKAAAGKSDVVKVLRFEWERVI